MPFGNTTINKKVTLFHSLYIKDGNSHCYATAGLWAPVFERDLSSAVFLAPEVTTAGQKGKVKLSADTKKQVAHIHCMQQTNKIL